MRITIEQFRKFVEDTMFTAVFKKQDGTIRTMNARLKVKAFVTGGDAESTDKRRHPKTIAKRKATITAKNMIGVWEASTEQYKEDGTKKVGAEKYRTLNLDELISLKAKGLEFGGE
jgi:hypothetical protein